MGILSEQHRQKLRGYQYKGTCLSPVYNHCLTHIAAYCVSFLPEWVAPNVITTCGMIPMTTAMFIALYCDPWLRGSPLSWYPLYLALAIFSYQTADNMDGKQARRIGASSGLGMLFDHVCDAINTGVLGLCMGSLFGCGWEVVFWTVLCFGYVPFYVQTWEEYYLKELLFPFISGPVEGLLIIMGLCVATYFNGVDWWHQEHPLSDSIQQWDLPLVGDTFTPFQLLGVFVVVMAISTMLSQFYTVVNLRGVHLLEPLFFLLPCVAMTVSTALWKLNSEIAVQQHPLLTYVLMSCIFVEQVTHLMLQLIVDDAVRPFDRHITWMMFGLAANVCFTPYGKPIVNETFLIFPFFFIALCTTAVYLTMICIESAVALDIYVFRVGRRSVVDKRKTD